MEPIENWNMLDILPEGEVKDKAKKTLDEFYEELADRGSVWCGALNDETFSSKPPVDVPKIKICGENK